MQIDYIVIKKVTEREIDEIVKLYKDAQWWDSQWNKSFISEMVENSCCFMIARNKDKIIGMARAIADHCSDAYIQDVIVLNKYQNHGIGGNLVKKLIKELQKMEIDWISLIGEPNTQSFYEKIGFKIMKGYIPMKYE
ncbi:GNAT family N-acetyltransferase [Lentisphaerota bacterium WC36G]|nr:GNAT family N-acetyltransferase [Lentisphaerae bacterium WC36]